MASAKQGRGLSKGYGKSGHKRHQRVYKDNIRRITKPAILRLAYRAGVLRISSLVYDEIRSIAQSFLREIVNKSIVYCKHRRKATVSNDDVKRALEVSGINFYGYSIKKK